MGSNRRFDIHTELYPTAEAEKKAKTATLDNYDYRHFPEDADARKRLPVFSGVIAYFPDAVIGVSKVSFDGNQQHNPGQPLHWSKEKSQDHIDALQRHMIEQIPDTEEGLNAAFQAAWRALANAQIKFERMKNADRAQATLSR